MPEWKRYRMEAFIGEGGMGRVFKAWDPRLHRHVAVKFLHTRSEEASRRFLREARAQARVDHPNVCKVYETGEVEGHPFIAMHYVDGQPLHRAAIEMTPLQIAAVLQKVALAVHAAHRQGLIHRDLKPSNIIVERNSDGEWLPQVLDFGLARSIEFPPAAATPERAAAVELDEDEALSVAAGLTADGAVVGTPAYMAPEQTTQDSGHLDVRADVYGLGVTLYELLAGQRPFAGLTGIELLLRKTEHEPEPLAEHEPEIAPELAAIVSRCLHLRPEDRYQSAQELADELAAFLDGEPVTAYSSSLGYVLRTKARKHRLLVAVIATALAVSLVAVSLWLHSSWSAARRAAAAQRFGQDVAVIETVLWKARTIPVHDTRPQQALVRQRMVDIERHMEEIGKPALGPGHFALGKASLALGEEVSAADHLQKAWNAGAQSPEVAYALGAALGALYQRELNLLKTVNKSELRELRRREIEAAFREPARRWLERGRGVDVEAPELVEGMIAFFDGRFDDALSLAREAFNRLPWLYEAKMLEGDIHWEAGEHRYVTSDLDGARKSYLQAEAAYDQAVALAPSDARCAVKLARALTSQVVIGLADDRRKLDSRIKAGLAAAQRAIAADPEMVDAHIVHAELMQSVGLHLERWAGEWQAAFDTAAAAAEHAVLLAPELGAAHHVLGTLCSWRAHLESIHGLDPFENLDQAIDCFATEVELGASYITYNNLGVTLRRRAAAEMARGVDAVQSLGRAAECFREAIRFDPDHEFAHSNLARVLHQWGQVVAARGGDPSDLYQKALESIHAALEISPSQPISHNNLGNVYTDIAKQNIGVGAEPTEALDAAIVAFGRAIELRPTYAYAHNNLGDVWITRAEHQLEHGIDPRPAIDRARATLELSLELRPGYSSPHFNLGNAHRVLAVHAACTGENPEPHVQSAERAFRNGLAISPKVALAEAHLARVLCLEARHRLMRGRSPAPALDRALATIESSLAIDPVNPFALAVASEVHALEAEACRIPVQAAKAAEKSAGLLSRALELNPNVLRVVELRCPNQG